MFKICVYVPEKSVEKVKLALFEAGAGKIGNYDSCCWQTPGSGQFRALAGSSPVLGEQGKTEQVQELKIELVCADQFIKQAVSAIKKAHPYEEPAYDVWRLDDLAGDL